MFDYLALRWKLFWLERGRRKTSNRFDRLIAEAKTIANAKERRDVIDSLESRDMYEAQEFDEDVYRLHTWYLRSEARRLIIPLDQWRDEEAWSEGVTGDRHMTKKAINELRAAVRAEKKASVERFVMWVPGIVGIIGASIGLASILFGNSKPPVH